MAEATFHLTQEEKEKKLNPEPSLDEAYISLQNLGEKLPANL